MRSRRTIAILTLVIGPACGVAGCATVTHRHITSEARDGDDTGVRYLGTSPYLIAYSNGRGGVVTELTYLPDPAKKMSARPDATLSDVGTSMEFDRGVLTTSEESGDATAVPAAIAKAIESITPALLLLFNAPGEPPFTVPAPYVFKIVVKGSDVLFLGSQGNEPIKVTVLPQPARDPKDVKE